MSTNTRLTGRRTASRRMTAAMVLTGGAIALAAMPAAAQAATATRVLASSPAAVPVISEVQTPEVESFNIAAGPEGSVWYTASGAGSLSEVGEIPAGGQPTYFSNGIFQPGQDGEAGELGPITLGPDDNLWFTQSAQPSLRGRFAPPDPAGHSQEPAAIKAWEHSQARPVGSKPVTYVVSFTH